MAAAAIFDVDGTLLDSVDLHAKAWQDAFADFGHEVDLIKIRTQIGKGGDQLLPVFLTPQEIEENGKTLEGHRGKLFRERYLHQIKPFPKVRHLFQRLAQDGVRVALATSAKPAELSHYRQMAGVDDLVEVQATSADAENSKPHPDIVHAALDRMRGVDRSRVVMVGDTPYDAQAAGKAGVRSIGLLCGGWSSTDLRDAGCIAVYKDPADLLAGYERSVLALANT